MRFLLKSMINILFANSCLQDFMFLVRLIADGSLPVTNIAFLLCLERAKWQRLCSAAAMRFSRITKTFWAVVYRILKEKRIQFFSGTKNWGHTISNMCTRGKMNPRNPKKNLQYPMKDIYMKQTKTWVNYSSGCNKTIL